LRGRRKGVGVEKTHVEEREKGKREEEREKGMGII
jgi:hypothetical protein